ncbi:MAG: hypothetical protein WBG92_12590 [Thiohalocapsa sp.]
MERRLMAAQNGELPPEGCIETLVGSEFVLPIYETRGFGGLQTDSRAQPLKLTDDAGGEIFALVASPECAKSFVKDFPGYVPRLWWRAGG